MNATLFALIVAAAIFVGVLALAVWLVLLLSSRQTQRLQRRLLGAEAEPGQDEIALGERPVLQSLARQGQAIGQLLDAKGEMQRLFIQAGWRDAQSRLLFYVVQVLAPFFLVVLVVLGGLLGKGKLFQPPLVYLLVLAALMLGLLLPRMILRARAQARRERIKREVPLFVHLLVLLFDAGLSTRQAFANLVREGGDVLPELGREVQLALRQIEAGGDTAEILRNLADGLEVGDLTTILGVLRQVDRYGGEIREPLLDALKVIEERHALDLREKVNLMSGRMTVVMVLFFFPALLIFTAGPAATALLKTLGGIVGR
jgi:tight adherence protein C